MGITPRSDPPTRAGHDWLRMPPGPADHAEPGEVGVSATSSLT